MQLCIAVEFDGERIEFKGKSVVDWDGTMEHYSAKSSNLAKVGYDLKSETLEVEFLNGSVYQYFNVPPDLYEQLMKERSKGKFLSTKIKNFYPFSRVG